MFGHDDDRAIAVLRRQPRSAPWTTLSGSDAPSRGPRTSRVRVSLTRREANRRLVVALRRRRHSEEDRGHDPAISACRRQYLSDASSVGSVPVAVKDIASESWRQSTGLAPRRRRPSCARRCSRPWTVRWKRAPRRRTYDIQRDPRLPPAPLSRVPARDLREGSCGDDIRGRGELDAFLKSRQGFRITQRIKVPGIHYQSAYWPLSRRAADAFASALAHRSSSIASSFLCRPGWLRVSTSPQRGNHRCRYPTSRTSRLPDAQLRQPPA